MVSQSCCIKTLHPLQVFSTKSSSSTLSSTKIKALIHTLIVSHVCRIVRALSKAKSILIQILKENPPVCLAYPSKSTKKNKNRKVFFGSFRLHYNWCSSHVLPVPDREFDGLATHHLYYDSTWNSVITAGLDEDNSEAQLSGYLQWLEEKVHENPCAREGTNEIDRLAEMFIANCHEQFRLEKQESCRRFQEMLARSM